MPPNPKSLSDIARGKRLEKWLEQVAPYAKPSYRGSVVLEQPCMTVGNWINGSQISKAGICMIIEVGGYGALGYILDTKPCMSNAKNTAQPDALLMRGKGTRFWYTKYIRVEAQTILDAKQDYSTLPAHSREAVKKADDYARLRASEVRSSRPQQPRAKISTSSDQREVNCHNSRGHDGCYDIQSENLK